MARDLLKMKRWRWVDKKIDQVGSFTYLGSIISKDGGNSEDAKSRIAKTQRLFFHS